MSKDFNVKYHLFLNGFEVPFQSASLTEYYNQPAILTVDIVPDPNILNIIPRTPVHLFFEASEPLVEDEDELYLLFEGEVLGEGMARGVANKSVQLTCLALPNYLDYAFIYHLGFNGQSNIFSDFNALVRAKGVNPINAPIEQFTAAYYLNVMADAADPGEGVHRIMNQLGTTNAFFMQQDIMYNFPDRVNGPLTNANAAARGSEKDTTFSTLLGEIAGKNSLFGGQLLARTGFQVRGGDTLHQFIDASLNIAYYEMIFNCGAYKCFTIKPQLYFAPPPKCNVIFPSQFNYFNFSRNYTTEGTRAVMNLPLPWFTGASMFANTFISPPFLRKDVEGNDIVNGVSIDTTKLCDGTEKDGLECFGIDEYEAGIVPMNIDGGVVAQYCATTLDSTLQTTEGSDTEANKRSPYLLNIVDYELSKGRYSSRNINVTGPFNPNTIVGYPCLLLNETMPIYGFIFSKTLNIDARGNANQVTNIGFARYANESPVPNQPAFLDPKLYDYESAIESRYDEWIHADRDGDTFPRMKAVGTNALRKKWSDKASNSHQTVAEDYLKRLTTEDEFQMIYGNLDRVPGHRRYLVSATKLFEKKYNMTFVKKENRETVFSGFSANVKTGSIGPMMLSVDTMNTRTEAMRTEYNAILTNPTPNYSGNKVEISAEDKGVQRSLNKETVFDNIKAGVTQKLAKTQLKRRNKVLSYLGNLDDTLLSGTKADTDERS